MQAASPEQVGFSSERLARLDVGLQRFVDQGKVAGVTAVLSRRGQIFHAKGYGLSNLATQQPMQPNTLIRLWSITKVITAVATLIGYEHGEFVLDQSIADFIPAFKTTPVYVGQDNDQPRFTDLERPITIRQLLTHTGGIASGFGGAGGAVEAMMRDKINTLRAANASLSDAVDGIAEVPLVAQPNTLWRYGQSFEILARLVEIISGLNFADFLQTHIFDPLGMSDTGYVVGNDRIDRFSAFYTTTNDDHLKLIEAPDQSIHYVPDGVIPPGVWTPGGYGLVSTAFDIQRLGTMLLNRGTLHDVRILAPRTIDLMTTNHLLPALLPYGFPGAQPMIGYGHGLGIHTLMDHGLAGTPCANGEYWKDGGSGTLLWVDPQHELVGTVCYQLDPFWIHPIFATTKALTYQALLS
ncbi:MAG: beta-lactamase family protein [Anaerolineae bacterium]|nr:beta-lactamase family protein [Anaerolineae bacterium]